jgi:predicted phosphodiesterase
MQVLVLSDIHANYVALEKILTDAPAYDTVWCLGDIVGYGPAPNECVARLREMGALALVGNHDSGALGKLALAEFSQDARETLAWTRRVMTPETRAWLASLLNKQVLPEHDLTLVHASPRDPVWEYIANQQHALENFAHFSTSFCFFGHTHRPISYWLREKERILRVERLVDGVPVFMEPKLLLNVGSAGQPRDGCNRAAFALYDTHRQVLTPYRIEYDIAAAQQAMRSVGLPMRLIERLEYGE